MKIKLFLVSLVMLFGFATVCLADKDYNRDRGHHYNHRYLPPYHYYPYPYYMPYRHYDFRFDYNRKREEPKKGFRFDFDFRFGK
jgi:hypothetical protein